MWYLKMRLTSLFVLFNILQGAVTFRVVCVYTNWAQYRPDGGKFLPEDVDPALCTHLIYVYAKLKGNKLSPVEWNDDGTKWSEGMYDRVNNLKQMNPDMKTLLGVGGWNMGSKDFSRMASGKIYRRMFARSAVKFLRDRKFDGLTIDWQHPTKRGGQPRDRVNFSLLLQEIRRAFDEDSKKTGLPALLLTAGVSASQRIIEDAYEVDNITKYTDFINVFAYDFHGSWENYTGHPSQLYARGDEIGPSAEMNVDASMRYWMSHVADRSKLVLGISTSGRTFTLADPTMNGVFELADGPGLEGDFTRQPGMLSYYERCFQYADATRVWDDVSKSAYWYSGSQWIAGEDEQSVKAKVHWMRYNAIGGIMLSSLDMDDYSGMFCTGDIYPLLITIHEQIVAPLPPNTHEGYHRSQAEKFQVYQPPPPSNMAATTISPHQPPVQPAVQPAVNPTTPVAEVTTADPYSYESTYAYYYDVTTAEAVPTNDTVIPGNNAMVSGNNAILPGNTWQGNEYINSANSAQQIPYQSQSSDNYTNKGPHFNTNTGTAINTNTIDKANQLQLAHQIQGTIENQIASANDKSRFGSAETFGTHKTDSSGTGSELIVPDKSQTFGNTVNEQNEAIIIAPAKATELKTFLKDAGTLPTHHLINGILGILSLEKEIAAPATTLAPVQTTSTTTQLPTTVAPIATTEEKPHSRVRAILPFSILSSFKGPISLFGGSTVAESRPLAKGVTNIWEDPYAQQFLRNSRRFQSRKKDSNKQSTPQPNVFSFSGPNTVNPSHFTSPFMGTTV